MTTWQNLTNSQKNYYLEFYAPTENNVFQIPRDDELVWHCHYTPYEAQINAVCDMGDGQPIVVNEGDNYLGHTPVEDREPDHFGHFMNTHGAD